MLKEKNYLDLCQYLWLLDCVLRA